MAQTKVVRVIILERSDWTARRDAHHARVDALIADHRWRCSRALKHPVEDFLFEYYTYRPSQLRRWHPGHGVILADSEDWLPQRNYVGTDSGVQLNTAALLEARGRTVTEVLALLRATSERKPSFGCFGMHEWAMVDGLAERETRHPQLGLRLAAGEISATLRDVGVRCTHVDAYRFFTPSAKPLNDCVPTREDQVELDQPGCLHVGMDLYRLAYKLSPMVGSDLIADCFELARSIRVLDMRASPYDVASLGLSPVAMETAEGRREYAAQQRALTEAANPLRRRLLAHVTGIAAGNTGVSNVRPEALPVGS